ncbi:hypothetical protein GPL21_18360 [Bradyrhizobium pachyrhizi]|uniref:Uncharacterized protein n=1 Tax=Bradyrhizobium pachyrhizi TaxID=280333 RepID=A0A844SNN0_9BRAD|nr:hypothetical protein [Bradyrhizobium pachyrhizi]MVT67065.1 hypothetical protein [Bradyrhizobium pachyrhizi]WFU52397.1 hypothetical protein QA639_22070 [Bradyrhizobium pachyrhizi]
MPLHRDIHWLGRQWAVTGHGLQLINQKQMGYYDIEAARLWDARVTEVQSKAWIDRPDFDKALEIARGKFAQMAPADLPPPPPPPVRATPPAAPRAPLDAASVPSIEELLARLKSKSAATASVAKPAEALAPVPTKPEPLRVEPRKVEPARSELPQAASVAPEPSRAEPRAFEAPKAESLTTASAKADPMKADWVTADPIKSELPTSELPKPPQPEPRQTAPIALEPARPEARRVEPPKVEALKSEAPKVEAELEPAKPGPPTSEAVTSRGLGAELRQTPRVKMPEAPRPTPVIAVVRRPARAAWPVFERKIAGSARFVRPWRVTSARWRGPSPGLPPRP